MQYANLNGVRSPAVSGARASCPMCGEDVIAKCGSRIVHHWAHVSTQCDLWWENETAWHRSWKNEFPEAYREVHHVAPDGEIHRADIKHPSGLVIEIQHSSMSQAECFSRENFYGDMVWIVDSSPFRNNFIICHPLPNPDSLLAQDLVWHPAGLGRVGCNSGMFYRISETEPNQKLFKTYSIDDIIFQIRDNYIGHRQYYWIRPHAVWLFARKPVYLDLGDNLMGRLKLYGKQQIPCIQYIPRKFLIDALKMGVIPPNF